MDYQGKFILIIGPTGSGKSALIDAVREHYPSIVYPVSCTTRAPRPGEVEGRTYRFLTSEQFDDRIAKNDFLEWASYGGNRYGTLLQEIIPALQEGKLVLREVEVQGARQIQKNLPKENLVVVFIDAGSWDDLERRVRARAPITDAEVALRRKRFEDEIQFRTEATYIIKNPDGGLEQATKDLFAAIDKIQASLLK